MAYVWHKGPDSGGGYVNCLDVHPTVFGLAACGGDQFGPHTTTTAGGALGDGQTFDGWQARLGGTNGSSSNTDVACKSVAMSLKNPGTVYVANGWQTGSGGKFYKCSTTDWRLTNLNAPVGFSTSMPGNGNGQRPRAAGNWIQVDYDGTNEYVYFVAQGNLYRYNPQTSTYTVLVSGLNAHNGAWASLGFDPVNLVLYPAEYPGDGSGNWPGGRVWSVGLTGSIRTGSGLTATLQTQAPAVVTDINYANGHLYASTNSVGGGTFRLYRISGNTWTQVGGTLSSESNIMSSIDGSSGTGNLYCIFSDPPPGSSHIATTHGIQRSTDGGTTWAPITSGVNLVEWGKTETGLTNRTWWLGSTNVQHPNGEAWDCRMIRVQYNSSTGKDVLYICGSGGMWISADSGATWKVGALGLGGGEDDTGLNLSGSTVNWGNFDWGTCQSTNKFASVTSRPTTVPHSTVATNVNHPAGWNITFANGAWDIVNPSGSIANDYFRGAMTGKSLQWTVDTSNNYVYITQFTGASLYGFPSSGTPLPATPSFTATPPGSTASTSATFTWTTTDTDPTETFEWSIDGGSYTNIGTLKTKTLTVSAGSNHTFTVRGRNANGVSTPPASFTWTVTAPPPPAPTLSTTGTDPTLATTRTFTFSDTQGGVLFDAHLETSGTFNLTGITSPFTTAATTPGTHTFTLRARDGTGQTSPSVADTWTQNALPSVPVVTCDVGSSGVSTTATSATFTWTDPDAGVTFSTTLDGVTQTAQVSPNTYSALAVGSHTFTVQATRTSDGATATSTPFTWTVTSSRNLIASDLTGRVRRNASLQEYGTVDTVAHAQLMGQTHWIITGNTTNTGGGKFGTFPDEIILAATNSGHDILLMPYLKGDVFQGPPSPDFPEDWYTHTATPATVGNRVSSNQGPAFFIMNPISTANYTDTGNLAGGGANHVYAGWKAFHAQDCLNDITSFNAAYPGVAPLQGAWLDSMGSNSLNGQVVPGTNTPETTTSWYPKLNTIPDSVSAVLPAGMLVFANGISGNSGLQSHVDGMMIENWLRAPTDGPLPANVPTDVRWTGDMDNLIGPQIAGKAGQAYTKLWTVMTTAQQEAWRQFTVASSMIANRGRIFLDFVPDTSTDPWLVNHGPSYAVNLAAPMSTFDTAVGYRLKQTAGSAWLYGRRFVRGFVLVNLDPTNSVNYALPRSVYLNLDGSAAPQNYTVPAASGIILTANTNDPGATPPPTPSLATAGADPTTATTRTFTFSDTQAGVTFDAHLENTALFDGSVSGSFTNIFSPFTTPVTTPGNHTFTLRAVDNTGLASVVNATSSWTQTALPPPTAPTVTCNLGASGTSTTVTSATFTWTDPDAGLTFDTKLDGAAFVLNQTSPKTVSGLALGAHTFVVRASRASDGQTTNSTTYSWTVTTITPPSPTLVSLSPNNGNVGTTVVMTGTNLAGATSVTFNGVSAVFAVNSGTQITTTVPAGAGTGPCTVTTPGGSASLPFTVAGTVADGLVKLNGAGAAWTVAAWQPGVGSGSVYAVTVSGSNVIVGGDFTQTHPQGGALVTHNQLWSFDKVSGINGTFVPSWTIAATGVIRSITPSVDLSRIAIVGGGSGASGQALVIANTSGTRIWSHTADGLVVTATPYKVGWIMGGQFGSVAPSSSVSEVFNATTIPVAVAAGAGLIRAGLNMLNADGTNVTTWGAPPYLQNMGGQSTQKAFALATSADGNTVYVGGDFTQIQSNGTTSQFRFTAFTNATAGFTYDAFLPLGDLQYPSGYYRDIVENYDNGGP